MNEYDIDDITVVDLEAGGASLLLRLDSVKGQILLRVPIDQARRLGDIMEWATTPEAAVRLRAGESKMGEVENVTRVVVAHPLEGEKKEVFLRFETANGSRGFLLDGNVGDSLLAGLSMLAQKGHTKH